MRQRRGMAFLLSAVTAVSMLFNGMALADTGKQTATPSNAQKTEKPAAMAVTTAADMLMTLKTTGDSDYDKIRDLTLHIIDPEEKTATVDELSTSAIRIFVFGDIVDCGHTQNIIYLLTRQLKDTNTEIYYLDIKGRSASEIIDAKKGVINDGIPYFLCQDKDNMLGHLFKSGGTMPFVFVIGKEEETLYLDNYSNVGYNIYVNELIDIILEAYPEETPFNIPKYIYMYPDTWRYFPVIHKDGYSYSSEDPEVAVVVENLIFANSPGTTQLTVSSEDMSADVTIHVLELKEDYSNEWEVLKILNEERIKENLLPLSTMESFQKAADIRAYEVGEVFAHIRPDGSSIASVTKELEIESPQMCLENIAYGQRTPESVMTSWMNSTGHRENILSQRPSHIGVGYQDAPWSTWPRAWVQYFGGCSGDYTEIALVINDDVSAEIMEGGTLNDLDYALKMICSTCGETWMPVIDSMCDFDPDQTGEQEVTVSYNGWSDTFPITVKEKILVQNIAVTPDSLTMNPGDKITLSAEVDPENVYNSSVTWYSTNAAVASVDKSGAVTANAKGTAEIYCIAEDEGKAESNHCAITVVIPVNMILIDKTELSIKIGDKESIDATVLPGNADNKSIEWHSNNPAVALVNGQGVVTGVSEGTTEIYCKAQDGSDTISEYCKVTVKAAETEQPEQPEKKLVQRITITPDNLSMKKGETASLSVNIYPEDADNKSVHWYSTKQNIVKVDNNGVVAAVREGSAEIYCISQDEGKISSNRCKVTVAANDVEPPKQPEKPEEKLVQRIMVTPDSLSMKIGETAALSKDIYPEDADNKSVHWYSTEEKIVKVDNNGVITAIGEGTGEIYCISQDEGRVSSNHCKVTVKADHVEPPVQPEQPEKKIGQVYHCVSG